MTTSKTSRWERLLTTLFGPPPTPEQVQRMRYAERLGGATGDIRVAAEVAAEMTR